MAVTAAAAAARSVATHRAGVLHVCKLWDLNATFLSQHTAPLACPFLHLGRESLRCTRGGLPGHTGGHHRQCSCRCQRQRSLCCAAQQLVPPQDERNDTRKHDCHERSRDPDERAVRAAAENARNPAESHRLLWQLAHGCRTNSNNYSGACTHEACTTAAAAAAGAAAIVNVAATAIVTAVAAVATAAAVDGAAAAAAAAAAASSATAAAADSHDRFEGRPTRTREVAWVGPRAGGTGRASRRCG